MNCRFAERKSFENDPWMNLAIESALAQSVKPGDVILYLWQNKKTVVIGRNQDPLKECRAALLESEGGALSRRMTGGGAVYQDMGNLNYTFIADPALYDVERQLSVVKDAAASLGIECERSGRNDLLAGGGAKFSGSAFSKTKTACIHHGTLMVNVSLSDMSRYLTPSKAKLRSKGVDSVRSRVCNLRELNSSVTTDDLRDALRSSFTKIYGRFECGEDLAVLPDTQRLYDIFSSWEFRYGRSPECEDSFSARFDWGEVDIRLTLDGMRIKDIRVFSDCLDTELPGIIEKMLLGARLKGSSFEGGGQLAEASPAQAEMAKEAADSLAKSLI